MLVNNAGVEFGGTFFDVTPAVWDKHLNVNLRAMFFTTQNAARWMRDNGGGAVVNIASIQGQIFSPAFIPYTASKAGVRGLTAATAVALAPHGIRVNAVAPGWCDTSMNKISADRGCGRATASHDPAGAHRAADGYGRRRVLSQFTAIRLHHRSDHHRRWRPDTRGAAIMNGMLRLRERVAIVTGGARGIGRAMALRFAQEGARVVVADLRMEQANATVHDIVANRGQALALEVDVARLGDLDRMLSDTRDAFGTIDILCNNAGVSGGAGDLFAYTEADWDRIIGINLKSAFFASQKVARVMIDQGRGGVILNTSSTSGFISSSRPAVPYDVSKAGLRQMTITLAAHLAAEKIRVNAIAPGTIDTELAAGSVDPAVRRERMEKRARERIPMQRLGQPDDLAGAAAFLLLRRCGLRHRPRPRGRRRHPDDVRRRVDAEAVSLDLASRVLDEFTCFAPPAQAERVAGTEMRRSAASPP